jgi:hypothetical protein
MNLQKPARYTLLEMLHTTSKDEEKFIFFGRNFSHRKFYRKSKFR